MVWTASAPASLVPPAHSPTVALVIGTCAYQHVEPLTNPTRDARAMRDTLTRLGFEVVYGEDLDLKRMGQKVGEFAALAQQADVALAYYAGRGSTIDQTSSLVPIYADYKTLSGRACREREGARIHGSSAIPTQPAASASEPAHDPQLLPMPSIIEVSRQLAGANGQLCRSAA